MLAYLLPSFLEYLCHHHPVLFANYSGRLMELFPSAGKDDNNLVIANNEENSPSDDERVLSLWKEFKKEVYTFSASLVWAN